MMLVNYKISQRLNHIFDISLQSSETWLYSGLLFTEHKWSAGLRKWGLKQNSGGPNKDQVHQDGHTCSTLEFGSQHSPSQ